MDNLVHRFLGLAVAVELLAKRTHWSQTYGATGVNPWIAPTPDRLSDYE
jgi:hypothetical protein